MQRQQLTWFKSTMKTNKFKIHGIFSSPSKVFSSSKCHFLSTCFRHGNGYSPQDIHENKQKLEKELYLDAAETSLSLADLQSIR